MDEARRSFLSLSVLAPVIAVLPLGALLTPGVAEAQSMTKTQPAAQMPLPEDDVAASGTPDAYSKLMLDRNQRQMKQDIDKLYSLAQQLKQQVDRTDSTTVLSLNLVDSAKKVEDLAKEIRNLARS